MCRSGALVLRSGTSAVHVALDNAAALIVLTLSIAAIGDHATGADQDECQSE